MGKTLSKDHPLGMRHWSSADQVRAMAPDQGREITMLVIHGHDQIPEVARGAALAIGNFDGVHLGHRALIMAARSQSMLPGRPAGLCGVMVFDPHPKEYFAPSVSHFRLTPLALKLTELQAEGVHLVAVLPFDAALAGMSAQAFVDDVLIGRFNVGAVVIGHDFRFGKGRLGDGAFLAVEGAKRGFGVTIVAPVRQGGTIVSSTAIRAALRDGDIGRATALRGRPWVARGVVHGGAKRGTGMGYPTANITLGPGADLAHGIYAVRVGLDGQWHQGAAYLGTRPTFDNGAPVLETFLFDFDGDLYGKSIDIAFIARLRPDRAFQSSAALVAQMDIDVASARAALAQAD